MTWLHDLDRWLRGEEMSQLLALFLLFSGLALVFSWSSAALQANGSWFVVTALRRGLLTAAAVWLGLKTFRSGPQRLLLMQAGLVLLSLLGAPFAVAAWAASYPSANPFLHLLLDTSLGAGVYGSIVFFSRACGRFFWLSLPLTAALLAAVFLVDELAGRPLLFPFHLQPGGVLPAAVAWTALAGAFALSRAVALPAARKENHE